MGMAIGLVWLTAGIFVVYGVGFALMPASLSLWVTGGAPSEPSGLIDMRSTYGGMSIGVGLVLALAARRRETLRSGLVGVGLVMVCMAASRLLGIVVDGGPNGFMWAYLALEVVAAALAFGLRARRE